jgi:small ligand-binding sensory domain FIST
VSEPWESRLRAAAALALRPDAAEAAREATRTALRRAGLKRARFAVVALGAAHRERAVEAIAAVADLARTTAVIGAVAPSFVCLEGPGVDEPTPLTVTDGPGLAVLVGGGEGVLAEAALLPDAPSRDLAHALSLLPSAEASAAGSSRGAADGANGANGANAAPGGNGHRHGNGNGGGAGGDGPGGTAPLAASLLAAPRSARSSAILLAPPVVFRPDRFAAGLAGASRLTLCGARLWAGGPPACGSLAGTAAGAADLTDAAAGVPLAAAPGKASAHRAALLLIHQGVALAGEVLAGASPIGRPAVVTRGGGRTIETLGGRPAVRCLEEALAAVAGEGGGRPAAKPPRIAPADLLVGIAANPKRRALDRGDFTVMPIAAIRTDLGSIEVDGEVRLGQTFAFLRRQPPDARSTDAALTRLCGRAPRPSFGLHFGGQGGEARLDSARLDLALVRRRWPDLPVLGFLSDGELMARPQGGAALREASLLVLGCSGDPGAPTA